MTIVKALKRLLTAMGGTPETTDNQTITEVLADIYMFKLVSSGLAAETTGVKFDTIVEALDKIAEVTEANAQPPQPPESTPS